jgi:hypothetical protein
MLQKCEKRHRIQQTWRVTSSRDPRFGTALRRYIWHRPPSTLGKRLHPRDAGTTERCVSPVETARLEIV